MAEVQEEKLEFYEPSVSKDRAKLNKNREVDKVTAEMSTLHVLPKPPGLKITWDQMMEYIKLLTPEMWQHFLIYVYRTRPKIRRQLANPHAPNYIDLIAEPFDLEWFIKRHGGGRYTFEALDTEKKIIIPKDTDNYKDQGLKRNFSQRVFECSHLIDDATYPPILDLREIEFEARENTSYITWLRNKGLINDKNQPVEQNMPNVNGSFTPKDMLDVMSFVNNMNKDQQERVSKKVSEGDSIGSAVGQILIEQMKQNDPNKQVAGMATLASSMKDIITSGKSDTGMTQLFEHILVMQAEQHKMDSEQRNEQRKIDAEQRNEQRKIDAEQRKHDMEMLRMMLDVKNPPQEDSFTKFQQVFAFTRDILSEVGRNGGGGRRSGWDIALDAGREIGLPVIQHVGNIIQQSMAMKNGQANPGASVQGAPAAFDPYRNPQATQAYANQLRAQQTPPQSPPQTPLPTGGPSTPTTPPSPPQQQLNSQPDLAQMFQLYGGLALKALNDNTPGDVFADNIIALMGVQTHAYVANFGEETMVNVMKGIQEFQVFGENRIKRFVYEFIHYEELGNEEDDDNEGEAKEADNTRPAPTPRNASSAFYAPAPAVPK